MDRSKQQKKKLITSYEKLSDEIKELFKEEYADGYTHYIQKIAKPNGETIFVVPLETEDTTFMIKVDVLVDSKFSEEEIEKEIFALPKEAEEAEFMGNMDEEKDDDKKEFELKHGSYENANIDDEEGGDGEEDEEEDDDED